MLIRNPDSPAPDEIIAEITDLQVEYVDFDGNRRDAIIEVNRNVLDDVRRFFELALEINFPIEKIVRSSDSQYLWDDNKLLVDNATSGFNYRFIKNTDRLSLHARGLAIDVNTRINPYIKYYDGEIESVEPEGAIYDPSLPGALATNSPLVLFMKERGWEWGGDWTKESGRIDYQHFEKALIS